MVSVYIVHHGLDRRRERCDKMVAELTEKPTYVTAASDMTIQQKAEGVDIKHPRFVSSSFAGVAPLKIAIEELNNLVNVFQAIAAIAESGEGGILLEDDAYACADQIDTGGLYDFADTCKQEGALGVLSASTDEVLANRHVPPCALYVPHQVAVKLSAVARPFSLRTPGQLGLVAEIAGVPVRRIQTPVFKDGSKHGLEVSTVRSNNLHEHDPKFVQAMEMLKDASSLDLSAIHPDTMTDIVNHLHSVQNPDYMYMIGRMHMMLKNDEESIKWFRKAFALYNSNKACVGNQSEFMKDYVVACRDVFNRETSPSSS